MLTSAPSARFFRRRGEKRPSAVYARNKPKVAEKASANNTERNRELRETVLQPEKKYKQ